MIPKPVNKIEKEVGQWTRPKNKFKTMLVQTIKSDPTHEEVSDLKKIRLQTTKAHIQTSQNNTSSLEVKSDNYHSNFETYPSNPQITHQTQPSSQPLLLKIKNSEYRISFQNRVQFEKTWLKATSDEKISKIVILALKVVTLRKGMQKNVLLKELYEKAMDEYGQLKMTELQETQKG